MVEPPRIVSAASHRIRSMTPMRSIAFQSDNLAEGGIAETCSSVAYYNFDTPPARTPSGDASGRQRSVELNP